MVEVFKTNVNNSELAKKVLYEMHAQFPAYMANFDLEDCDKILRVESTELVNNTAIIHLLAQIGIEAEILEDETIDTQAMS